MDQSAGADTAIPTAPGTQLNLSWVPPNGLVGLSFANFLLRILTLGIYNFWGKTEIRRRVWSAIRLDGEPLSYTGTGKELFLGFMVILAVILVPTTFLTVVVVFFFGPHSAAIPIYQMLLYAFFFFLTGIAIYRAQRYRLSRTNWRGIRGALVGSDTKYSWLYCWTAVLIPLTLGWIMPWRSTALQDVITNDMRFGNQTFRFSASAGPLYGPFAVFWAGATVIVLSVIYVMTGAAASLAMFGGGLTPLDPNAPAGVTKIVAIMAAIYGVLAGAFLLYYLLSAWYRARQINHFSNHTHFENAKLHSTVTGGGLIWIAVGNFLLRVAGFLIGLVLLGVVFAVVAAVFPIGSNPLSAAGATGQAPGILTQAGIFTAIIVLAASMGLFAPIIQARVIRYLVDNLSIDGHVPLDKIAQGADQQIKRGEGLAQAFDIDGF